MKKRTIAVLAMLVALLCTGITTGTAVADSSQCTGAGRPHDCQDPQQTGCSGNSVTVASEPIVDGTGRVFGKVELRWSRTCLTNWARVTSTQSNAMDLTAEVVLPDASASYTTLGTLDWSDMLYGNGICAYAVGWVGVYTATTVAVC